MTFARSAAVAEFREAPTRRPHRPVEVCEDSRPVYQAGKYVGHAPIHATARERYAARVARDAARVARDAAKAAREARYGRATIRRQRSE